MDIVRETPKTRLRWAQLRKPTFAAAALVAAATAIALWRSPASAAPAFERRSVWTEKVTRGELVRQVPVQGALVPEHVQWLSAETAARVAKIVVRPGEAVEPDTVVLVLQNTELELAAIEATQQAASAESKLIELDVRMGADETQQAASLATMRADLRDADRHADNANRLAPQGLLSENERADAAEKVTGLKDRFGTEIARHQLLTTGRARQLAAQRSEIESIKEIAAFRQKQLAALSVRAGVHGVVQDIPLENGQWVAIGTVLAKIAEPGKLKAELKVAESYAKDLSLGLPVAFEGPGPVCQGKITRIDPSVVAGTVKVQVHLDAVPANARVDERVSGFVEIERLPNVLHVARPAGAVDGTAANVFRVEADGTHASRVDVRFGRSSLREMEVVNGLREGDEVVVSDVSAWDGAARVRLK